MGVNKDQLRRLIIETLKEAGNYRNKPLLSDDAVELLIGTAAQESHLGEYLYQLEGGPARGIFQMEPKTLDDIWNNFLQYRVDLTFIVSSSCLESMDDEELVWNMKYAIIMARIHYLRAPEALPSKDDVDGMAKYWKKHWNTEDGKGTVQEFIDNYGRYVG